jgi:DNA invertase Pin-like site-specific DNA recombinase
MELPLWTTAGIFWRREKQIMVAQGVLAMPRVAYSLIRWSSPIQKEGHSKERQEDFAPRWCRENNARLDDSMCMILDGQSAYRGHHRKRGTRKVRPLADFLEAIRTGRVSKGSILIMENIDRLSREEIDEAWELFRAILKAGVDVVTQTPERHYTKESLNDLFAILEVKFSMYRAHEESKLKGERVRKAWLKKKQLAAEKGIPVSRSCPAWIELGKDDRYRLIPDRAEIVRQIFKLTIDGWGAFRIASFLSHLSNGCFGRKGKWTAEYVRVILKRQAAFGAYEVGERDPETGKQKPTGEVIRNYYPAVVSEADWHAAQKATKGRYRCSGRPGEGEANLFTGIVFDAESKEAMHKKPCVVRGVKYNYLIAHRAANRKRVPYEAVEAGIVRMLGELKAEDVLPPGEEVDAKLRRIGELTQEVEALADRLKTLEEQQIDPKTNKRLLPSIQRGIIAVSENHEEKTRELRQLEEEAHTNRTKPLGACQSALALLDTAERRRTAKGRIRQLVESIWLLVQPVSRTSRIVHVQIYLRGGRKVYRQILPPNPPAGLRPWPLRDCDFRAGNVGDIARQAETA